ncbi:hypothetical protein ABWW58_11690 [Sporolactobacillus sp. STCC-11]|uniref:hypothetical protein n=1 Tax=Sporolactobacillus caesalpiniae TaxID=3230362 RepID=UPI003394CFAC
MTAPSLTFASNSKSDQELDNLYKKGKIVYQDKEITVGTFGNDEEISNAIFNAPNASVSPFDVSNSNNNLISPLSSVSGPGGRASIVAGDTGRIVYWSAKPNTAWPYIFNGTVKLRYYSGFARDAHVAGSGVFGSSVSGYVTMNKNNGGIAYFEGHADALDNTKFVVLPGVHCAY